MIIREAQLLYAKRANVERLARSLGILPRRSWSRQKLAQVVLRAMERLAACYK